ncbi:hypothetical protein AKKGGB_AKKGGB_14900, partial [Dysosmobacter welbionis]
GHGALLRRAVPCPGRSGAGVTPTGFGAGQAHPGHLPGYSVPKCSLGRNPLSGPAHGAPVRDRAFHEAALRPDGPHGAYMADDASG